MPRTEESTFQLFAKLSIKVEAAYFTDIFDAAAGSGFGLTYFERRLKIGHMHNAINLPVKWMWGVDSVYLDIVRQQLRRSFRFQPGLRGRAERAISTVFNFDMQAVFESFVLDVMMSAGMI